MDYRTAVVGIVEYRGQILIAKKKQTPGHVLDAEWHIPGGKVKQETEEAAIIREIREEASIDISVLRFLDEKIDERSKFRVRWYLCSPLTHDLKPGDDVEEVRYVPKY